jgi:hypothetical protein
MRPTPTTRFHIDPFRRLRHPSRYVLRSIEVPTAHLPGPLTAPANRGIDCSKAAVEHSALTLALAVAGASSADSVLQSSQERSRCLGVRCRRTTGPAWLGAGASETSVLDRFTSSRTCTCSSPFTPTRSIASRSRGPARTSGSRGPMETQRPPCSSNTGFHVSKPRTLCCANGSPATSMHALGSSHRKPAAQSEQVGGHRRDLLHQLACARRAGRAPRRRP